MVAENNSVKPEETIFFIDLITDFIKKKILIKGIKSFIEEKSKFNIPCSFGMVMFQGEKNPVILYDKEKGETIIDVINESWNDRKLSHSYFENGIFEILSYIFGKVKKGIQKTFRIIIISDTPSGRSEDYHEAVYDLIVKSKNFSTYIDILRVGNEKFYDDEVRLKIISSETHGGTFYCSDHKHFLNVLGSLVKHKQEFNIVPLDEEGSLILKEDKTFYERLAVDLITLNSDDEEICTICDQEICPICEAFSDEIHKCFNCGTKFHGCCAAQYAITNNVGFRHIFRCPQCETLLKLDEELVNEVYVDEFGGKVEGLDKEIEEEETTGPSKYAYESFDDEEVAEEKIEQEMIPQEPIEEESIIEESYEEPQIIIEEVKRPQDVAPPPPAPELRKTVKVGGFFGREIEIKASKTAKAQSSIAKTISEESAEKNMRISITKLKPPSSRRKTSIKFCKICGESVSNATVCPTCGAKID